MQYIKNLFYSVITPEYKIKFEERINKLRSLNEMKFLESNIIVKIDRIIYLIMHFMVL